MLSFANGLKIFLSIDSVDLRKSFDGLYGIAKNVLKEDPLSGSIFLFTNSSRNRVKLLYFDGTGLWVMAKRLEKGTFYWPKGNDVTDGKLKLTPEAMTLLLDGVDLKNGTLRPWYQRD
jgi:transposase